MPKPAFLSSVATVLAAAVMGCSPSCKSAERDAAHDRLDASGAPGATVARAPVSASPSGSVSPAAASRPNDAIVDLLLETEAKLTVSSRVDNPRDYPEHLVDGRPETAWNGKTGDLHGWIEIVLPPAAKVTAIEITAGFDKKKDADDLFLMNHRIAKIRVLHDGVIVKEAALDTSKRELQRVLVDGAGGTWRIEVVETVPGTKKEWQELVVSDLKMYGYAGFARLPYRRLPQVNVAPGSAAPPLPLRTVDAVVSEGRFATTLAALCAGFDADMQRAILAEAPSAPRNLGPFCRPIPAPVLEGTLPAKWKALHALDLDYFYGGVMATSSHVVIEAQDGTFMIGPAFETRDDLGCFSTPEPLANRLRIVNNLDKTFLVASRTHYLPRYEEAPNGMALLQAGGSIEYSALSCLVTGVKVTCPEHFTTLATTAMTPGEIAAFKSRPDLRWPALKADSAQAVPSGGGAGKIRR